ncbi:hypothetical protein ACO9S2_15495 [Nitrospira sp. NS4]|uniref:hypothetical protein n=1 Tax=Nitrospira sp. NS4 TaxID=3414498 RepID=UPI003C2E622C
MPKLITRPRPEQIVQQAQDYVKSYILLPSGIVGLICMIGGVGGLGYQLLATDSYTWGTFYQSTGLIVLGVLMGIAQTRYHQFLLAQFPEVLAARMRTATAKKGSKVKKDADLPSIDHQGRQLIPGAYFLGTALILGSSWLATMMGQVDGVPALLLPWAGFYWARLFFWRGRV